MEEAIKVRNLVKRYGSTLAVDSISFEVKRGEIFAMLGPNGAGKTTTVEILECVRKPTSGEIFVLGNDLSNPEGEKEVKKRIGVLPQDFNGLGRLTVRENLEFFSEIYDKHLNISELLDMLGLKEKEKERFDRLSGGLKQRVGVAVAFVNDPELVFLDEPTTGLDPDVRRTTWEFIREMKKRGKTIFLTTHYMEEAEQLADRIAIIIKGKLAALDTPHNLIASYGGSKSVIFRNAGETAFGTLRRFFENVIMDGNDVVVQVDNPRDIQLALNALFDRGLTFEMEIKSANMEYVFLKLTGYRIKETGEIA
jgi:ABC-2 type transport system ATP-binding protein